MKCLDQVLYSGTPQKLVIFRLTVKCLNHLATQSHENIHIHIYINSSLSHQLAEGLKLAESLKMTEGLKLAESLKMTEGLKLSESLKLAEGLKSAVMLRLQHMCEKIKAQIT